MLLQQHFVGRPYVAMYDDVDQNLIVVDHLRPQRWVVTGRSNVEPGCWLLGNDPTITRQVRAST